MWRSPRPSVALFAALAAALARGAPPFYALVTDEPSAPTPAYSIVPLDAGGLPAGPPLVAGLAFAPGETPLEGALRCGRRFCVLATLLPSPGSGLYNVSFGDTPTGWTLAWSRSLPGVVVPSLELDDVGGAGSVRMLALGGGPDGQFLLTLNSTGGAARPPVAIDNGDQLHLGGTALCR